ncbi:MAG: dihydrodipicolinate synthase family protein [Bryobacteraceae bacterium]
MTTAPLSGVFTALVTPIDASGGIDLEAFDRVIDFVTDRGIQGIVIGGGTGEYPHFDVPDRLTVAAHAVRRMNGRGRVITCVGTSSIHSTLRLARGAADTGSDAILIPMPYFFRYEQEDLAAFCESVARSVSIDCLLYNLPSFTNPLQPDTAIYLLRAVPNLVGMKDSSGDTDNLKALAAAPNRRDFSLFVGDDSLLLPALQAGWDGVVSGIGCFFPELISEVYRAHRAEEHARAAACQTMLDELIEEVVRLPIPWGVRVGLAARGVDNGPLHLPLSAGRSRSIEQYRVWLERWAASRGLDLRGVWTSIPAAEAARS